MATEKRKFHLGDILSCTTEILASPTEMSGVYEIVNFMTGKSWQTIGLKYGADICAKSLRKQFPEIAKVTNDDIFTGNDWETDNHMKELISKYGEWHEVAKI